MAYENTGYLAFANSLAGLGQNIGGALQQRAQMQSLASLGPMIQSGDYAGASKAALEAGNQDLGIKFALLDAEKRKTAEQRALDNQVLQGINGGVGAQQGVTGGVTPNPQPMNLPGGMPDKSAMSQYIVEAARARGIDPGIALKVAQSEGLGGYTGDGNSSFGPFQLHYGGVAKGGNAVPGLGDEFTKTTGLDARNPQTWKQQVDFSLDQAKKGGWGPWHGWKGDQWAGLRGPQGVQVADASGAIPAGITGDVTQGSPVDGLMAKRENILRALAVPSISDNARQQLNTLLKDTEFQIERADKKTAQVKPEMKQFGDTVYRVEGGTMTPVQKIEKSTQEKALTADQSNAAGFADRMTNAEKVLSDPELMKSVAGSTGVQNQALGNVPLVGQKWQSADFKRYERAKKDFITAQLRKESGASISPTEFANEEVKYFPQPWDDPQTILDKAQARQIAIASMKRASGPAAGASPVQSVAGGGPLDEARAAIAAGADRNAVIQRLKANGIDAAGL